MKHVFLLEAIYPYEGDSLIGVYARQEAADRKAERMRKAIDRYEAALAKGKDPRHIPDHTGASQILVTKVRVIP
jgi:hypothetical protein